MYIYTRPVGRGSGQSSANFPSGAGRLDQESQCHPREQAPFSPVLGAGRPEKGLASRGEKLGIGGCTKTQESRVQSWLCGHGELLPLWASVSPPIRGRCPFRIHPQGLT